MDLQQVVLRVTQFLMEHKLPPPSSIKEYDILKIPGLSRAWLSKNGIKASQVIRSVNSEYVPFASVAKKALLDRIKDSTMLLEHLPEGPVSNLTTAKLVCSKCEYSESITIKSILRRATVVCKRCTGSIDWVYKLDEFLLITNAIGVDLLNKSDYRKYVNDNLVHLVCKKCRTPTTRTFEHIVHKKKFSCDTCNPSTNIFSTKTLYKEVWFDSQIECEAFKLLEASSAVKSIAIHISYKELGVPDLRGLEADFLVNGCYVVEVSTYTRKHHPDYHKKIDLKQELIESCTDKTFIFCNSLAEVEDFIDTLSKI